jgi:L-fuculose-phosphate aldolase
MDAATGGESGPTQEGSATRAARERVAHAARRLAHEGLALGTSGNVSERVDELVAVTPTGAVLEHLTADQVAVVDLDGEPIEGELEPTSELGLHLRIYRELHAGAVTHTHAPLATALSCVLDELPVIHYHQVALGGPIRVARYETFGTEELGEVTLEALDGRQAALMANHGAIVSGVDMRSAVENALLLEWLCGVYWHAAVLGTPRLLTDEQCRAVVQEVAARSYGQTHTRSGFQARS